MLAAVLITLLGRFFTARLDGTAPPAIPGALATNSHGQIELVSDGVGP